MDMFVAIADPTRRTILELLASRGELSATAIYAHFPVSPQAVSQHLKVLREAQLVEMEKRAQQRLYRLNPQTLSHFEAWVQHMQQMWSERFDALDAVLAMQKRREMKHHMPAHRTNLRAEPGKQEIIIEREFDAPRELVFRVVTDPTQIPHWWGPRYLATAVDKMDVRPGGQWRFINRDAEGNTYAFHGVYHEVLAPERIIGTFEFEGLPETGHVTLETMKLEALPTGRTRLTVQSVFQSVADRDGMLQSGMQEGVQDTHDRLAEILKKV
jgi:uncharacterized protein YndB with AHSA1/START domain/DNA-binding transcriptional ArsR family regulator